MTQNQKAIKLFLDNKHSEALKLFSTFRNGFTKAEKRVLEIARECETGKEGFYKSLGIDCEQMKAESIEIMKNYCQ